MASHGYANPVVKRPSLAFQNSLCGNIRFTFSQQSDYDGVCIFEEASCCHL